MRLPALALAATLAAAPALAFDPAAMTEAERDAFNAAVRAYILENPEVLAEAFNVLESRQAAEQAQADEMLVAANLDALTGDDHSYVGGNPEGDVTLVEFIDYRCSFCRRAHPEVAELLTFDGNIRKIVKEFPILGPESVEASRFAIATLQTTGPEAYAVMNDILIAHRGGFGRETMASLAEAEGIDPAPILAAMDDAAVTEVIRKNHQLAQALQITGTPTFVFGDQMVRGYVELAQMLGIVAEVRATQ